MMAAQSQQLVEELEGASREFESGYRTRVALLKFAFPLAALAFVGVRARGPYPRR